MFCTNCGKKTEESWRFCKFCGEALCDLSAESGSEVKKETTLPAFALFYSDRQELVFQRGDAVEPGRTAMIYTDFEDVVHAPDNKSGDAPWKKNFSIKKVIFKDKIKPKSMAGWFGNLGQLSEIEGIENLDTSEVTNMNNVFAQCTSLKKLDLSHFDTSKVVSMRGMFFTTEIETLDLSSFDTSNVRDMAYMFYWNALLKTIYVSERFVTANVEKDDMMFKECFVLVGGCGTNYSEDMSLDSSYARIDTPFERGYFTKK